MKMIVIIEKADLIKEKLYVVSILLKKAEENSSFFGKKISR